MNNRPRVLLSAAVSVDGYLDDITDQRLILSSPEDLNQVKRLRGDYDAIMVGATTIQRDDPSLRAIPDNGPHPRKVTLTRSGDLNPDFRFFATGEPPIVFCPEPAADKLRPTLADRAEIHPLSENAGLPDILATLWQLGIRSLMVEGGGVVHTQFLTQGLADKLRLAIAPFFVGDDTAPCFAEFGWYPHDKSHRMQLDSLERLGDTAVLHYTLDNHR